MCVPSEACKLRDVVCIFKALHYHVCPLHCGYPDETLRNTARPGNTQPNWFAVNWLAALQGF